MPEGTEVGLVISLGKKIKIHNRQKNRKIQKIQQIQQHQNKHQKI